jgi:hypothetical protein
MNSHPELETQIDHALKALPELEAPRTLAPRVLAALAARSAAPWHRRPWTTWPRHWQCLSFAALAAVLVGLYAVGGQFAHSGATQPVTGSLGLLGVAASLVATVGQALLLTVKHLNPTWLAAALLVLATGWFSCVGLGTALFRLAAARR